jgi:hypothetical protein
VVLSYTAQIEWQLAHVLRQNLHMTDVSTTSPDVISPQAQRAGRNPVCPLPNTRQTAMRTLRDFGAPSKLSILE